MSTINETVDSIKEYIKEKTNGLFRYFNSGLDNL